MRADRARRTAVLLESSLRASGDRRAHVLDAVVELNLGVAEALATRYRRRGVSDDDLTQVAYEGLVKAVHRFQPEDGRDLLAFAVPTIRGELRRHFRDRGWVVRPPRRVQELQLLANRCIEQLQREQGREPTSQELIGRLGVSESDYREAMAPSGCFRPLSLDQTVRQASDDGATLGEVLAEPEQTRRYDRVEARVMLEPVLARLEGRDRQIVRMRFFEDLTQAQIGRALGVTQTQVSRLLTRILRGLRQELEGSAQDPRGSAA